MFGQLSSASLTPSPSLSVGPPMVLTHFPWLHCPLLQSLGAVQLSPMAHPLLHASPQSTSASPGSHCPFVHGVCGMHKFVRGLHVLLAQSLLSWHPSPVSHPFLQLPPQSLPVSSPFGLPSVQLGSAHLFVVQLSVLQSVSFLHACPGLQNPHSLPPQSLSVSP